MKKLAFAVLIAGAVFALSQCELFNTTLEYNVSGTSTSLAIMYQDENGELVQVTAVSPWSTTFELFASDTPFLAFIQVTNNDVASSGVNLYILGDGSTAASDTALAFSTADAYAVIY
jgi:hypothetical protein